MKTKNIDVQEAIASAEKVLEQDKTISVAAKAVFKLLIAIISMFLEKSSLNSSNSGKPPASDPNRVKKKKFKQYDFILISELNGKTLEYNKLYLQLENGVIIYQCLDKNNTIIQGEITVSDLPKNTRFPKDGELSEFNTIRKEILKVLVDRGDIEPLRKPGGQSGSKGTTLSPIEEPDEIKELPIDRTELAKGRKYTSNGYSARQIVEINISRNVIEYRAEVVIDDLGNEYIAEFPKGINRPVQYGGSVKARSTFSSVYQLVPYKRVQEQFVNEYRIPLSVGSIYNFNKEASDKLAQLGFDSIVKKELMASDIGHADETSINIDGKKIWLHNFSNKEWTWLEPHQKRGIEAMNDIGIIPGFRGALCHDHWKSYFIYLLCVHSLCNAHHLRELIWSFEYDDKNWAKKMHTFLTEVNKEVDNTKTGCLSKDRQKIRIKEYKKIIADGEIECPAIEPEPGKKRKPKQGKSRNLLVRLRDYIFAVLLFMMDPKVPFTNNQGERDLRMIKVHQKISGCFKTIETAKQFCRIRSYMDTCRKNGVTATEALELLFNNNLPEFLQDKLDSG